MDLALDLAAEAAAAGENGKVLAATGNRMRAANDPTAHAELEAIRAALAARGTGRLDSCDLYVTLEPCAMCAGAIAHARIRRVIYAAADPKAGAVDNGVRLFDSPSCHHKPEVVSGIGEARSSDMLKSFFAKLRD
jgi:tRNA(adenine34) deaminase